MNLYVYRVNEREYGAGLGLEECQKRGTIVERWPLNTPEQVRFVASHGTSYGNATQMVTRIANVVHDLMVLDPTFRPEPEKIIAPVPTPAPTLTPAPTPGMLQRIKSWCFAH